MVLSGKISGKALLKHETLIDEIPKIFHKALCDLKLEDQL